MPVSTSASDVLGRAWTLAVVAMACLVGVPGNLRGDAPPSTAAENPAAARARERIRDMMTGMKDVPLPLIVEALTEHKVLPWQGESKELLQRVGERIEDLVESQEIEAARMNEVGNRVEAIVLDAMHDLQIQAGRAVTESGRGRSAGYPDLEAEIEGRKFYVEVKTFSAATIDSTQRSFYLSPSTDFKVTHDAIHLLVAVEMTPGPKGAYRAQRVRWLDLSGLRCDLKYEFNASNRDLYAPESGLVIVEVPARQNPADPALQPAAAAGARSP